MHLRAKSNKIIVKTEKGKIQEEKILRAINIVGKHLSHGRESRWLLLFDNSSLRTVATVVGRQTVIQNKILRNILLNNSHSEAFHYSKHYLPIAGSTKQRIMNCIYKFCSAPGFDVFYHPSSCKCRTGRELNFCLGFPMWPG